LACFTGYPEGHPNVILPIADGQELSETEERRVVLIDDVPHVCSDADFAKEIAYLKEKVDAGASMVITQMFFDIAVFQDFVTQCREAGILVPIIPGLMLLQSAGGFERMTKFCKTRVPAELVKRVSDVKHDEELTKQLGIDLGAEMSEALLELGAPGLHFYTLNLERVTFGVLDKLGRFIEEHEAELKAAGASSST
jgi:methylenetetrahydrofolate reductase (NADPH)